MPPSLSSPYGFGLSSGRRGDVVGAVALGYVAAAAAATAATTTAVGHRAVATSLRVVAPGAAGDRRVRLVIVAGHRGPRWWRLARRRRLRIDVAVARDARTTVAVMMVRRAVDVSQKHCFNGYIGDERGWEG